MKKMNILLVLMASLGLLVACSQFEEDISQASSVDADKSDWINQLSLVNTEQDILIVQAEGSIQEAIDVAGPNTRIYIEPGEYKERIKLARSDIQLVSAAISAEGSDNSNDYTASLTQTSDYERLHIADPDPGVPAELNFGHADLWLAYDAPEWV